MRSWRRPPKQSSARDPGRPRQGIRDGRSEPWSARVRARLLGAWKHVIVVSGAVTSAAPADGSTPVIKAFGWMMPGRIRLFDDDDIDEAKRWLVTPDED